jgi:hypothetical protein
VTWIKAAGVDGKTGDEEIWYGLNSQGSPVDSSVSVTMTSPTSVVGGLVWQLVGVATAGALDTTATRTGIGKTITAPSMTTSADGDLLVVALDNQAPITACGPALPDWWPVAEGSQPKYFNAVLYEDGAAQGPFSSTCTQSAAGPWTTVGIALKADTQ